MNIWSMSDISLEALALAGRCLTMRCCWASFIFYNAVVDPGFISCQSGYANLLFRFFPKKLLENEIIWSDKGWCMHPYQPTWIHQCNVPISLLPYVWTKLLLKTISQSETKTSNDISWFSIQFHHENYLYPCIDLDDFVNMTHEKTMSKI